MKRRGFLAGILAAGVAPAIVHNPMKIFVPKQDIVLSRTRRGLTSSIIYLDEVGFFNTPPIWDPELEVQQIQDQIVEKIRQMSYRLYTESGYIAAAQEVNGLAIQDPAVVQYQAGGHV